MKSLRIILGDQLSPSIAALAGCNRAKDVILMCEVHDEATYVRHHKKKIAFLFSAMRHFAASLEQRGYQVIYTRIDHPDNTGSLRGEAQSAAAKYAIEQIITTHPGEFRVLADMQQWSRDFGIPVEIRNDDRFLCSPQEFADWAKGRRQVRMEHFYREMRKKYAILMDGGKPVGGQWNYDAANRKPPQKGIPVPAPYTADIDSITHEVIAVTEAGFSDHFGDLQPWHFAVTRVQALQALHLFIEQRLSRFGDYQDAMLEDEPWMYHAHIGLYLNCGLLLPLECVKAAEESYRQGKAPLNAVEGFIRQIIGWREYVRGVYWLKMPDYATANFFAATRRLPDLYWTANTRMHCLRVCVQATRQHAYAHHIQRLMVLGNFALLAGIDPKYVNEWFLIVYADACEWVELPNVSGMTLFADGGYLASKPYAAGGAYINRMSDYCKHCSYRVTSRHGPDACPFNYLYWDFLARNRAALQSNHRMGMMYKTYDSMDRITQKAISDDSASFLRKMDDGAIL